MKKLLIILGVFITVITTCAFVIPEDIVVNSSDPGMCVTTGNCSVNLVKRNAGEYYVEAHNYNDYKVTVSYEVWGYDSNGNRRKVSGGTLTATKTGYTGANPNSSIIYTSCEDLALENVSVWKCD